MPITLLLLPGLDGTGVLFERFVEALPDDIDAHVLSYPGDHPMSYADLLGYIRDRLPAGKTRFAVLGESFSGPLALELALVEPRVNAVILCASFVTKPVRYVPQFTHRLTGAFWCRATPRRPREISAI